MYTRTSASTNEMTSSRKAFCCSSKLPATVSSSPRVEATFSFKDQRITLKLKSEIVSQIRRDIQAAVKKYGPLSSEYFSHVRKLSIDYWYNMDRAQIFEEVKEAGKDTTE